MRRRSAKSPQGKMIDTIPATQIYTTEYDITPEEFEMLKRHDLSIEEVSKLLRLGVASIRNKIDDESLSIWRTGEGGSSRVFIRGKSVRDYMVNVQGRIIPELPAGK